MQSFFQAFSIVGSLFYFAWEVTVTRTKVWIAGQAGWLVGSIVRTLRDYWRPGRVNPFLLLLLSPIIVTVISVLALTIAALRLLQWTLSNSILILLFTALLSLLYLAETQPEEYIETLEAFFELFKFIWNYFIAFPIDWFVLMPINVGRRPLNTLIFAVGWAVTSLVDAVSDQVTGVPLEQRFDGDVFFRRVLQPAVPTQQSIDPRLVFSDGEAPGQAALDAVAEGGSIVVASFMNFIDIFVVLYCIVVDLFNTVLVWVLMPLGSTIVQLITAMFCLFLAPVCALGLFFAVFINVVMEILFIIFDPIVRFFGGFWNLRDTRRRIFDALTCGPNSPLYDDTKIPCFCKQFVIGETDNGAPEWSNACSTGRKDEVSAEPARVCQQLADGSWSTIETTDDNEVPFVAASSSARAAGCTFELRADPNTGAGGSTFNAAAQMKGARGGRRVLFSQQIFGLFAFPAISVGSPEGGGLFRRDLRHRSDLPALSEIPTASAPGVLDALRDRVRALPDVETELGICRAEELLVSRNSWDAVAVAKDLYCLANLASAARPTTASASALNAESLHNMLPPQWRFEPPSDEHRRKLTVALSHFRMGADHVGLWATGALSFPKATLRLTERLYAAHVAAAQEHGFNHSLPETLPSAHLRNATASLLNATAILRDTARRFRRALRTAATPEDAQLMEEPELLEATDNDVVYYLKARAACKEDQGEFRCPDNSCVPLEDARELCTLRACETNPTIACSINLFIFSMQTFNFDTGDFFSRTFQCWYDYTRKRSTLPVKFPGFANSENDIVYCFPLIPAPIGYLSRITLEVSAFVKEICKWGVEGQRSPCGCQYYPLRDSGQDPNSWYMSYWPLAVWKSLNSGIIAFMVLVTSAFPTFFYGVHYLWSGITFAFFGTFFPVVITNFFSPDYWRGDDSYTVALTCALRHSYSILVLISIAWVSYRLNNAFMEELGIISKRAGRVAGAAVEVVTHEIEETAIRGKNGSSLAELTRSSLTYIWAALGGVKRQRDQRQKSAMPPTHKLTESKLAKRLTATWPVKNVLKTRLQVKRGQEWLERKKAEIEAKRRANREKYGTPASKYQHELRLQAEGGGARERFEGDPEWAAVPGEDGEE